MAIDWMPIEIETPDKPEILQVAEHLGIDPDSAFGKCFRVWGWFDRQTIDGVAIGVSPGMLEAAVRSPGIAAAMESAGWLQVYGEGEEVPPVNPSGDSSKGPALVMPNFRVHCGESAKKRHQDQRRKERERSKTAALQERDNCHAESVTDRGHRRRTETESENKNSGPDRTGPGPSDLVSYGFGLPDWPELEPWSAHQVEPEDPGKLTEGAFRPLSKSHLGNPRAIAAWHAKQLSIHRPVTGGTGAHRVLCVAAGIYADTLPAAQVRKSRVGLFVSLVKHGSWDACRGQIPKALEALQELFQAEEAACS